MEGFYKFDGENWLYAPHFVYAKDYILEKDGNREETDGNREETDGWKWYDEKPLEYTVFKIKQNADKTLSQDYEETN